MFGAFDVNLADFPRLSGENSDDFRIMRAVNECERGVLYIPKGVYEIANMLTITNCCSFLLHKHHLLPRIMIPANLGKK